MNDETSIRPSRGLYGLAAVLLAVGSALFAGSMGSMIRMIMQAGEGLTQIVVPGEGVVQVAEPGTIAIYHEYQSAVGGQTYANAQQLPGLTVTVTGPDGQSLPLQASQMSENYTMGSRQGVRLFQFDAPTPGEYRVEGSFPDASATPAVLAVGTSVLWGMFGAIGMTCLGTAVGGICCLAAMIVFVVTIIKRSAAKKRIAAETVGAQDLHDRTTL